MTTDFEAEISEIDLQKLEDAGIIRRTLINIYRSYIRNPPSGCVGCEQRRKAIAALLMRGLEKT